MLLYATGYNAWNQLQFDDVGVDGEPDDFSSFTCVLQDDVIGDIRPFLSYTRVSLKDGASRVAGMVPKDHERLRAASPKTYASFVEASNGVVVVHDGNQTFTQHPSIRDLLSGNPSHTFPNHPDITQLVAYATGFAALSSTGDVHTWGDERYTACLGRDPTDDSPATHPAPIPDLTDLPTGPITKLAAGGYLLAALTAGHDLYCWGHAGRCTVLGSDELTETPTPLVIDDGKDIVDVAVGEAHMLVLTADSEVYVIGDNTNGQLGLPGSSIKTWTRIDLDSVLETGSFVTGVAAGPRNSFLIVYETEAAGRIPVR